MSSFDQALQDSQLITADQLVKDGKNDEALALYKDIMARNEDVDQVVFLTAKAKSAGLFWAVGDNEEAMIHFQQALSGFETVLGGEHEMTLSTMLNFASLLKFEEQLEDAKSLLERLIEVRERLKGSLDPDTLQAVNSLGEVMKELGFLPEAKLLFKRAVLGFEQIRGLEDERTLESVYECGCVCSDLGDIEEAVEMFQSAFDGFSKTLGPDDCQTIDAEDRLQAATKACNLLREHVIADLTEKLTLTCHEHELMKSNGATFNCNVCDSLGMGWRYACRTDEDDSCEFDLCIECSKK